MNNRLTYISIYLLFSFCSAYTHQGAYISHIKKLNRTIETKGPHKKDKYQKKVLGELKSKHTSPPDIEKLVPIIQLFAHGDNYPMVTNNQNMLELSVWPFRQTPGYQKTLLTFLSSLDHPGTAKGSLYELQRAVALREAYHPHDPILAFNVHRSIIYDGKRYSKEFDIVTPKYWIECKDRNFDKLPIGTTKNSKELCDQLLAQKDIVTVYNDQHATNITFQLSSKQPLPGAWQDWLDENNIEFFEGIKEHTEA